MDATNITMVDTDILSDPASPSCSSIATDETDTVQPHPTMFKDLTEFFTLVEEEGIVDLDPPDWYPRILGAHTACTRENLAIALKTIIRLLECFRAASEKEYFEAVTKLLADGSRYSKSRRDCGASPRWTQSYNENLNYLSFHRVLATIIWRERSPSVLCGPC